MAAGGTGATFLDWTIQYLTNQELKKNYVSDDLIISEVDIPHEPLTNKNCHLYYKTHPRCHTFKNFYNKIYNYKIERSQLYTLYTVNSYDNAYNYLNVINDYTDVDHILFEHKKNEINLLFSMQYNRMGFDILWRDNEFISQQDNIWDQRELWSLYFPKMIFEQSEINMVNQLRKNKLDNVYLLNYEDFINNFDEIVIDFLKILQLNIINKRIDHWNIIYKRWQKLINLNLYNAYDDIIFNIVNNNNLDLTKFKITFADEIVLCSKLLFEYNLSLKCEGIIHMPQNTKEWHALLEHNIYHNLNDYMV